MRSIRCVALALVAALLLVSCSRDKESVKKRYLESGNKYFEKKRFKEASIQYGNAVKLDPRYGLAHYKLALVALSQPQPDWVGAVRRLRRAVELIPESQQEHWDAVVRLAQIYLTTSDESLLGEVQGFSDALLKRNPNSIDGLRLTADLNYVRAVQADKVKKTDEFNKYLEAALEGYRKADAAQPGNPGIIMQLTGALALKAAREDAAARPGDLAAAERNYRTVIAKDPSYLEAYRDLYTLLWLQDRRKDAEEVLRSGFKANPTQYGFLVSLASQYQLENRRDDMVGVLQELKSKAAEYRLAYYAVGNFYLRMGDGDSAVREYREGIDKDSKNKAFYQKAIVEVYMRQGKRQEAADLNAQILKDNPNDNDARELAAATMMDRGDVAKAMTELQQVVTRAPGNSAARYNLGVAYARRGDSELAREQFNKAIEQQPGFTAARLQVARLQVAKEEYDGALRSTQDILKYDANNAGALLIQGAALMGLKRFDDAQALLGRLVKDNPGSSQTVFELGLLYLAEKKYKDAEASFRRAYELDPGDSQGLMGLVETYMAQGLTDQAISLLRNESDKTPSRMDLHYAIGKLAARAGRWDMAFDEYRKVLATTAPGSRAQGDVYYRIGELYRQKGDYAAAIDALQNARKATPDDTQVLRSLAVTLDSAGKWNEARQVYEAIQRVDPGDGRVLNNLAFGLAEHNGDLDVALGLATRAKQILPAMPDVSDTLGWIYLKKNLPDSALPIFEDISAKNPGRSTFHYHLALALAQKGDKPRAREELKKALATGPDNGEKQKIQDLMTRM